MNDTNNKTKEIDAIDEKKKAVSNHFSSLIVYGMILTPIIIAISFFFFRGHIDIVKAENDFLKTQLSYSQGNEGAANNLKKYIKNGKNISYISDSTFYFKASSEKTYQRITTNEKTTTPRFQKEKLSLKPKQKPQNEILSRDESSTEKRHPIEKSFINKIGNPEKYKKTAVVDEAQASPFIVKGEFQDGLALVKDTKSGKFGYINDKYEIVIKCIFEYALDFSNGIAVVLLAENQYAEINTKGETVRRL